MKNPQKNTHCISKIVKTLIAMVNSHPKEDGYVLLGIADNKHDEDQVCSQYNIDSKDFNGHYIVGVERRLKIFIKILMKIYNILNKQLKRSLFQSL